MEVRVAESVALATFHAPKLIILTGKLARTN
eukprot:SAG11_NODE_22468_length_405_cov_2.598039_1_plen_30_part_01